ncbi:hypothetical protein PIB30_111019, partial [Stylosanthes scabra]|nr:hypothetical protein [Stylosanthes scabra]
FTIHGPGSLNFPGMLSNVSSMLGNEITKSFEGGMDRFVTLGMSSCFPSPSSMIPSLSSNPTSSFIEISSNILRNSSSSSSAASSSKEFS